MDIGNPHPQIEGVGNIDNSEERWRGFSAYKSSPVGHGPPFGIPRTAILFAAIVAVSLLAGCASNPSRSDTPKPEPLPAFDAELIRAFNTLAYFRVTNIDDNNPPPYYGSEFEINGTGTEIWPTWRTEYSEARWENGGVKGGELQSATLVLTDLEPDSLYNLTATYEDTPFWNTSFNTTTTFGGNWTADIQIENENDKSEFDIDAGPTDGETYEETYDYERWVCEGCKDTDQASFEKPSVHFFIGADECPGCGAAGLRQLEDSLVAETKNPTIRIENTATKLQLEPFGARFR